MDGAAVGAHEVDDRHVLSVLFDEVALDVPHDSQCDLVLVGVDAAAGLGARERAEQIRVRRLQRGPGLRRDRVEDRDRGRGGDTHVVAIARDRRDLPHVALRGQGGGDGRRVDPGVGAVDRPAPLGAELAGVAVDVVRGGGDAGDEIVGGAGLRGRELDPRGAGGGVQEQAELGGHALTRPRRDATRDGVGAELVQRERAVGLSVEVGRAREDRLLLTVARTLDGDVQRGLSAARHGDDDVERVAGRQHRAVGRSLHRDDECGVTGCVASVANAPRVQIAAGSEASGSLVRGAGGRADGPPEQEREHEP